MALAARSAPPHGSPLPASGRWRLRAAAAEGPPHPPFNPWDTSALARRRHWRAGVGPPSTHKPTRFPSRRRMAGQKRAALLRQLPTTAALQRQASQVAAQQALTPSRLGPHRPRLRLLRRLRQARGRRQHRQAAWPVLALPPQPLWLLPQRGGAPEQRTAMAKTSSWLPLWLPCLQRQNLQTGWSIGASFPCCCGLHCIHATPRLTDPPPAAGWTWLLDCLPAGASC